MGRLAFFVFWGALATAGFLTGSNVSSHECVNGACRVLAATSPWGLLTALLMVGFVILVPRRAVERDHVRQVKIVDVVLSFFIDFVTYILMTAPFVALYSLLLEYHFTGVFTWSFERDYERGMEALIQAALMIGVFFILFGYFYAPILRGQQTPGQYLMGFRVEGLPGSGREPRFGLGLFLGFAGLAMWPVSLALAVGRSDKRFWWNRIAATRLVAVSSTKTNSRG